MWRRSARARAAKLSDCRPYGAYVTLRPVMDGRASELRWTAVAVVMVMVLSAVDLSLPSANISGALVVAPFLASGARPGWVAVVGGLAATGAIGLAFFDDSGLTASAARMTVIVVGTVVAAQASTLRPGANSAYGTFRRWRKQPSADQKSWRTVPRTPGAEYFGARRCAMRLFEAMHNRPGPGRQAHRRHR